jgi:hypothetical protein
MSYKITYWDQKDGFALGVDSNSINNYRIAFYIDGDFSLYPEYFANEIIIKKYLSPFNYDIIFFSLQEVFDFMNKKFIEANKDLMGLDKISKIKLLLVPLSDTDIINVLIEVNKSGDKEYLNDIFIALGKLKQERILQ